MKIINKVITALGNPKINEKLKKKSINIVSNDIQYQEGILEYLEENKNINYLIIDRNLPGNFEINELIFNIKKINKKIKIILISDKEENISVYKIIKEIDINKIIDIINNQSIYNKQYIPLNEVFNEETNEGEITSILGPNGVGKSIFSVIFAKQNNSKKILIIDFDIFNNNLYTLLGENKYSRLIQNKVIHNNLYYKPINIQDFIIQTNSNIHLVSGINLLFNSKRQPTPSKIRNEILKIKNNYDLILIDTATNNLLDYTKELIKISDNSIFISGANLLEIKKSQKLLEIYNKEWGIQNNKVNIIFNKCTNKSVDDEVLRRIFKNYNILGKIKLNEYYDLAINNNKSKIPQIEKEIINIEKKFKISKKRKMKVNKVRRKTKIL